MKRSFLGAMIAISIALTGCVEEKNVALVATASVIGNENESLRYINTDDMSLDRNSQSLGIDQPNIIITAPDGKKAYVASAHYPLPPAHDRNWLFQIDMENDTATSFKVTEAGKDMEGFGFLGSIFDMELSQDGSRLFVGNFSVTRAYVSTYDTATLDCINYFTTDLTSHPDNPKVINSDFHRGVWDMAVNPKMENVVYVLAGDGVDTSLRAFDMDDTFDVLYRKVARLLGEDDYYLPYSGAENSQDYSLIVDPEGELVVVLSDKLYPFRVEADGSLTELYGGNGVPVAPDNSSATLFGKTEMHFTKNDIYPKGIMWVNSSGIKLGGLNLGGGSMCLDKDRLLNEDADPYVYSVGQITNGLVTGLLDILGADGAADFINNIQFYGVSASAMAGDYALMTLAPIASMDLVGDIVKNDAIAGKTFFVAFKPIFAGTTPTLHGAQILDIRPNLMAVNPDNDMALMTSYYDKELRLIEKSPTWATTKTRSTKLGDGNLTYAYPHALGFAKYEVEKK